MLSGEATHTNFIVFGLTRSGLEPTIYRTGDEYANQYTMMQLTVYRRKKDNTLYNGQKKDNCRQHTTQKTQEIVKYEPYKNRCELWFSWKVSISCSTSDTHLVTLKILVISQCHDWEKKDGIVNISVIMWSCSRRRVWRYQRGNQNPYIEEEQTTQWRKENKQKDKQLSTKHTYKTKDRVTRIPLKPGWTQVLRKGKQFL